MEGGFKESALRLNAYVVKLNEWNEQTIKERAALLADKAKQIWAYPDMTAAELAPYQTVEKPAERYSLETYDSVKQFYLNVYEALGNLLIIPVALNNIKYRADANSMNPLEANVSSLEDFIKLTKASRYHFCLNTEVYTDFLRVVVNAKLRNAIGHNDVEYDAVSQIITYIPNPKDRTIKKTEYLLEFENEAMHMFQALLGVSEYLYRLRELSLMYDGKIPLMVQERANWPKKIGRNDPCPCGSGKKYKFCHGRN